MLCFINLLGDMYFKHIICCMDYEWIEICSFICKIDIKIAFIGRYKYKVGIKSEFLFEQSQLYTSLWIIFCGFEYGVCMKILTHS